MVLSEDGTGQLNQADRYFWINVQNIAIQVLTPDGRDLPGATGELYYNIHDRLGSIRQVIDTNIAIINRFDYDPYGKTTLEDIAAGCNYSSYHRFAGYKWEPAAGMYNCNARWYDPELMRFISRDQVRGKFRDLLSLHRYLYCLNNSVNLIDPDGKFAIGLGLDFSGNLSFNSFGVGSFMQKGLSVILKPLADIAAYTMLYLPMFTAITEYGGMGGSIGGAFLIGKDTNAGLWEGWTYGTMKWAAGGPSIASNFGAGFSANFLFSPDAQKVSDLSGSYIEGGASIGQWGLNWSEGYDNDGNKNGVMLYAVTYGFKSTGYQFHGFSGKAWVDEYIW